MERGSRVKADGGPRSNQNQERARQYGIRTAVVDLKHSTQRKVVVSVVIDGMTVTSILRFMNEFACRTISRCTICSIDVYNVGLRPSECIAKYVYLSHLRPLS